MLKHQALPLLLNSDISDEFKSEARRLAKALEAFADIPEKLVPEDSLLREFLGK